MGYNPNFLLVLSAYMSTLSSLALVSNSTIAIDLLSEFTFLRKVIDKL
jgi:hypothetical protein